MIFGKLKFPRLRFNVTTTSKPSNWDSYNSTTSIRKKLSRIKMIFDAGLHKGIVIKMSQF